MYTCTYSYVCTDCYPACLSATSYRKHPTIQCQDDPATRGEERAPRRVRVTPQRGGGESGHPATRGRERDCPELRRQSAIEHGRNVLKTD